MIVLIPAYEPDQRLVALVKACALAGFGDQMVIVNDGSGAEYEPVFAEVVQLGGHLVSYEKNQGKGRALKAGFAYITAHFAGHDVVCADCDGQHTPPDIVKVAEALASTQADIVLGVRAFDGDVPARSRIGNDLTRWVFKLSTKVSLADTQTGLRAYQAKLLPWLQTIDGDRFEYELSVLLAAKDAGLTIAQTPIATIYLDGNHSSHFRPIRDSVRIYAPLVKFSLSSLASFVIDFVLLLVMMAITNHLALSIIVARVISASVNFATNRHLVFARRARQHLGHAALKYAALALVVLLANIALMHLLNRGIGVPLALSKLITEISLFTLSYQVQKRVVFRPGGDQTV